MGLLEPAAGKAIDFLKIRKINMYVM